MFNLFKRSGGFGWIVVFLGNPGQKYEGTRHNVGFMTADKCEKCEGISINRLRFKALTGQTSVNGENIFLMKPQTFMNLSGEAVSQAASFYKVPAEKIIVVSDDVSLPVGKLRVRAKGSAGGHNGLKNIIERLGSDNFPRIKVGVGQLPNPEYSMVSWVLGTFKGEDARLMDEATDRAWQAVKSYITDGVDKTMNRFN